MTINSPVPDGWDAAYHEWLDEHRVALEAHDWARAFAGYPWIQGSPPPKTFLKVPLSQARMALVSSAGVCATDQMPFDAQNPYGDATFRVIAGPLRSWQVHHGHYDTTAAQQDYNTVFPLRALERLAGQGMIGSVSRENYTFMGYQPDPRPFYRRAAPTMLEGLIRNRVDGVLLVPG